jgi:hypothetical protein
MRIPRLATTAARTVWSDAGKLGEVWAPRG